jgi:hypothetical protein
VRGALLQRLQQTAGGMKPQEVSNSVYALGRLGWRVPAPILAALFAAIDRVWANMIPQEVSNTLYGLANMPAVVVCEVDVPPKTHAQLCSALVREAQRMTAQQVANSIWALGQLRWHFDDGVKGALEAWLMERGSELTPQGVSNTLLGLAAAAAPLSTDAMAALLTAVDAKLLRVGGTEEPMEQTINNTLYAMAVLAHLGVAVEEGLVLRLAESAMRNQLDDVQCFQVRPVLLVARWEMRHMLRRVGTAERDSPCTMLLVLSVVEYICRTRASLSRLTCMQVVDSFAFFQHAGMALPEAYDAFLTECRKVVQCKLRVMQSSPGAKHLALAAAVQQLARDSLASSCVEVRGCHRRNATMLLSHCDPEPLLPPHHLTREVKRMRGAGGGARLRRHAPRRYPRHGRRSARDRRGRRADALRARRRQRHRP